MYPVIDPVIDFGAVSVRRGAATLLDGIDWVVEEDERWVVLGPNGAGKTTLMQVASAQLHPSEGEATILGETLGGTDVFEISATGLRSVAAPLLEEERYARPRAAVTKIQHPLFSHRPATRTRFPAGNHPVDALQRKIGERTEQRLGGHEADGGRNLPEKTCATNEPSVLNGHPHPEIRRPWKPLGEGN